MSHYYTLYSPSVFSLAKSLQLILEITMRTQCMMSDININLGSLRQCVCRYFHQNDYYLDYCRYHTNLIQ